MPRWTVRELWRFPVKSMGGERLEAAEVGVRGVHGDRLWSVRDEQTGTTTHAKRLPELLLCTARFVAEPPAGAGPGSVPDVVVTFPDGAELRSDDRAIHDRLSALVGRKVTLTPLQADKAHYRLVKPSAADMRHDFAIADGEPLPDFSMMPLGKLMELGKYATPPGTYFDAATLHVLTTASLAALRAHAAADGDVDVRRFRANLVLDTGGEPGFVEADWTGGTLTAGGCAAFVDCPTPRCAMPIRAQPGLPAEPRVLKSIVAHAERCLGAYATVTKAGRVAVGDPVTLEPPRTSKVGDWARARATGMKRALLKAMLPK